MNKTLQYIFLAILLGCLLLLMLGVEIHAQFLLIVVLGALAYLITRSRPKEERMFSPKVALKDNLKERLTFLPQGENSDLTKVIVNYDDNSLAIADSIDLKKYKFTKEKFLKINQINNFKISFDYLNNENWDKFELVINKNDSAGNVFQEKTQIKNLFITINENEKYTIKLINQPTKTKSKNFKQTLNIYNSLILELETIINK